MGSGGVAEGRAAIGEETGCDGTSNFSPRDVSPSSRNDAFGDPGVPREEGMELRGKTS